MRYIVCFRQLGEEAPKATRSFRVVRGANPHISRQRLHRLEESGKVVLQQTLILILEYQPMLTDCNAGQFAFEALGNRKVTAAFDGGAITSNAGALLLRQVDQRIGLSRQAASCFSDGRDQDQIEHRLETLLAQRMHGIALGYEDLNDHDELRHDPVLGLLSGKLEARRSDCAVLAGKSTLNRLEHAPEGAEDRYHKFIVDGEAMKALFINLFIQSQKAAPRRLILDLDATDDPLHGHQEGRFFHGYYKCYCYLPLYVRIPTKSPTCSDL